MSSRARAWALAAATVSVVVIAGLLVLPLAVRRLAVQRVEAMTGRPVALRDVDLNLFTRRLVFHDLAVQSADDAPPLVRARRIEARFRLVPLLTGEVHLDELHLVEPAVLVVRDAEGGLSAGDVIEHWRARAAGEPVEATIDRIRIEHGRVAFADHAVTPDQRWTVESVSLDARHIATRADAAAGRATARFVAAGAAVEVAIDGLHVRPFRARAEIRLDGLDIAAVGAYLPDDAALRLAGGRFSTRATVAYDADGRVHGSADSTLTDLALARPGQSQPFVRVPHVALRARDVAYAGQLAVADLVLSAERAVVLDARAPRPRPLEIRDVRFTFQNTSPGATGPGALRLTAKLPGDADLDARGTGEIFPPRSDVQLELRQLPLALAAMWLPPGAALEPADGRLGASLALRYGGSRGLRVDGRAWIDGMALARDGAPFLTDDRVEITAADVVFDDHGPRFGRLALTASPTITPRAGDASIEVPELTMTASDGGVAPGTVTRLEAQLTLPRDGRVTARGEAHLGVPDVAMAITAKGLDARLAAPYLPKTAALRIERGRLDARLDARWAGVLDVDGDLTVRRLTVARAGQEEPFVEHERLDASVSRLRVAGETLSVERVAISGAPVIVDGSVSPPQRFELRELSLIARDVTWPGQRPIDLEGHAAAAEGGRASLRGALHPSSLATDLRLTFEDVPVTRAKGYLPGTVPLLLEHGRAEGALRLRYARGRPVRLDGEGNVTDLALTLAVGARTQVSEDRLTFAFEDVVVGDGRVAVGTARVDGSPRLTRADETAEPFDIHAEVRALTWPGGGPADFRLRARPGDGQIDVAGTFTPSSRVLEATVRASDAALLPFAALVPIDAPVSGRLNADGRFAWSPGAPRTLTARGHLAILDLRVGPEDMAPLRAAEVRIEGVALEGRALDIDRLTLSRPSVLVERERNGAFPLRAMLTPDTSDTSGAASPETASSAVLEGGEPREPAWRFAVDDIRVVEGSVRFLDRTTTPFYSEEITNLAVTLRDVTNVGNDRAGLMVQGIVGTDASLDLRGEVAPFATPFYLEVSGELRNFAVPRTNPYLDRFLDWIARRGELTTRVQYRIVGRELQATNELVVHRLDVARARDDAKTERAIGLPLGLVVALLKDSRGDIRFTLPVSGELGSPTFRFGDAIRSALSSVLGRLVTGPLRAIGSVFRRDGRIDAVRVEPAVFAPGSAALTADAAAQLQRVADFLRASPYVNVSMQGVATERDLQALRARAVVARIQQTQRERRLDDFAEAAGHVWAASMPPGSAPPDDPQGIVRVLAAREPVPPDDAQALAERRRVVARTHLVDAAGIPRQRLLDATGPAPVGAAGDGRVEFELQPGS